MINPDAKWRAFSKQIINYICAKYAEGESYGIIADRVNLEFNEKITRSSIAGVIFRLQKKGTLEPRKETKPITKKAGHQYKSGHPYHKPRSRPMKYPPSVSKPVTSGKKFLDLNNNECKYCLGELQDIPEFFCGDPTLEGMPFCAYHHSICYTKPNNARKAEEAQ